MKILFFSTRSYDKIEFRKQLFEYKNLEVVFTETSLNANTAIMAKGYDAICIFTCDNAKDETTIRTLAQEGVKTIALRCAGFDNVNDELASELGITVIRVPSYSPESIAEHAMTLALASNAHIVTASNRLKTKNFSLVGLSRFCLHGKTAGIVGYGKIGKHLAEICRGYGMKVVAYDPYFLHNGEKDDTKSVDLKTLYMKSDFIFLTTILNESTHHMINKKTIKLMKDDVVLVNVSRGGLIKTEDLIKALKDGKFFAVGLDVYEGEDENVFANHEDDIRMKPVVLRELSSFDNVVITSHQAFLTDDALKQIAITTLDNLAMIDMGLKPDQRCIVK